MPTLRKCPSCGSIQVYRSHRRFYEYLLVGFRPFRCYECKFRYREFTMFKGTR